MDMNDSYPLYWRKPYQKEVIAKIIEISKNEVKVNQDLFYPSGGGQLADKGTIIFQQHELEIIGIEKKEEGNWLIIKQNEMSSLTEGDEILLKLDWNRRYSFMKSHTAQHLISNVLEQSFDIETLKANIEEEKFDIEISRKLSKEEVLEVLKKANQLIDEGAEVKSIIVDNEVYKSKYRDVARGKISNEKRVRLIQLGDGEGFDLTCCGGVHINNLSEIKGVFLETFKGDSLKILLDKTGIEEANIQRTIMVKMEELTEKRGTKLVDIVANKLSETQVLQEGNLNLLRIIFGKIANWSQVINEKNIVLLDLPEIDRQALQSSARELEKGFLVVVLGRNDILYFISTDETIKANDINAKIIEKTGAKGGGNKGFAQVNVKNIGKPLALVQEVLLEI